MTDGTGTTTYQYDHQDRLVQKVTPAGTLSYSYDAAGHVASLRSSNLGGVVLRYTYDTAGRLSTVIDDRLPAGQNTTSYSYDAASNLSTATYPNGLTVQARYDAQNRLVQQQHVVSPAAGSSSPVANYQYTLTPAGHWQQAAEAGGRTVSYGYDLAWRLTSEAVTGAAGVGGERERDAERGSGGQRAEPDGDAGGKSEFDGDVQRERSTGERDL